MITKSVWLCHRRLAHHLYGHLQSISLAACSVGTGKASLPQQVQYIIILTLNKTELLTPYNRVIHIYCHMNQP